MKTRQKLLAGLAVCLLFQCLPASAMNAVKKTLPGADEILQTVKSGTDATVGKMVPPIVQGPVAVLPLKKEAQGPAGTTRPDSQPSPETTRRLDSGRILDMTTLSCQAWLEGNVVEKQKILYWLDGWMSHAVSNTALDRDAVPRNGLRIGNWCREHAKGSIMDAVTELMQ